MSLRGAGGVRGAIYYAGVVGLLLRTSGARAWGDKRVVTRAVSAAAFEGAGPAALEGVL